MTSKLQLSPERRQQVIQLIRQGVIIVILLAVVAGVYFYLSHADHGPQPQEAQGPGGAMGPVTVTALTIEPRNVPLDAQYLAQTVESQTVPIRARVSGFLIERSFEEGQRVEKGQVIYRIDPKPYDVALVQARAGLAAAQARLDRASQQLDRFRGLADLQSAAASELEQWQQDQKVAAADVQLQQAYIEQAQLDLDYATINAPLTGMIGRSLQDVGSYIGATGDTLLATIRQVDPMYVRYSMSEQDLLSIQRLTDSGTISDKRVEELEVHVILPDGRTYPHIGRINYVDVAVDPSTGTAVVRATVPNPQADLRPGQFVTVRISGRERLDAILVPQSAVMQSVTGTTVYVIDDNGQAQLRHVQPGEWLEDQWIIESGLVAGDRVIVDQLMKLRPGSEVRVATAAGE